MKTTIYQRPKYYVSTTLLKVASNMADPISSIIHSDSTLNNVLPHDDAVGPPEGGGGYIALFCFVFVFVFVLFFVLFLFFCFVCLFVCFCFYLFAGLLFAM